MDTEEIWMAEIRRIVQEHGDAQYKAGYLDGHRDGAWEANPNPLPPCPADSPPSDYSPRPEETVPEQIAQAGIRPAVLCADCGGEVEYEYGHSMFPLCEKCLDRLYPNRWKMADF